MTYFNQILYKKYLCKLAGTCTKCTSSMSKNPQIIRLLILYFFTSRGLPAAEEDWEDSWVLQHDLGDQIWATLGSEFWSRLDIDCCSNSSSQFLCYGRWREVISKAKSLNHLVTLNFSCQWSGSQHSLQGIGIMQALPDTLLKMQTPEYSNFKKS